VLQFDQKQRNLLARGSGKGAPMAVHTVLVSSARPENSAAAKTAEKPAKVNIIRIQSRELAYSDLSRQADFTGGVKVDSTDGSLQAQQAKVYLQSAGVAKSPTKLPGKESSTQGFMAGSVERIVANGPVELDQPGRRATGQQLVYTASDGMFVLTGTPAMPPKIIDSQRGAITGASLRFHAGDQNVVVSKEGDNGAEHRVRTETRVKNRQ
jgi:lipopolysaccharide export system protein LptA